MATKNIFDPRQVHTFFSNPKQWSCSCGHASYTSRWYFRVVSNNKILDETDVVYTIICQCGHELTLAEYFDYKYKDFCDAFSLIEDFPMREENHVKLEDIPEETARKNDTGKLRVDLLLDMPRALKAIADLMEKALIDYKEGSWLCVYDAEKRYRAAHLRHVLERAIDPIDPQFGLDHDVAIALNAMFILELRLRKEEDNVRR